MIKTIIIMTLIIIVLVVLLITTIKRIIKQQKELKVKTEQIHSYKDYITTLGDIDDNQNKLRKQIKESPEDVLHSIINNNNARVQK